MPLGGGGGAKSREYVVILASRIHFLLPSFHFLFRVLHSRNLLATINSKNDVNVNLKESPVTIPRTLDAVWL